MRRTASSSPCRFSKAMASFVLLLVVLLCSSLVHFSFSLATMSAASSSFGPVLGVKGLSKWAVVGDVTNQAKPAFRVANRLQDSGRTVYRVSPYVRDGSIYRTLAEIPSDIKIDAVNLVVSPRIGVQTLEEMAKRNIRYCFIQPGADTPNVLDKAAELGITVQQGCVLVQPLPPLELE